MLGRDKIKRTCNSSILNTIVSSDAQKEDKNEIVEEKSDVSSSMLSSIERNKRKKQDETFGKMQMNVSSKKHKKEKKKHKKEKHKTKKSKKFSNSGSSSDDQWVEKEASNKPTSISSSAVECKLQRDSWMVSESDFVPTFSKKDLKTVKETEKPKEDITAIDRELNPYWKDGGIGLPEDDRPKTSSLHSHTVGDGGVSWLQRAYKRAVDQAKEEHKSLEEIASERWGSLEIFEKMLSDANEKAKKATSKKITANFERNHSFNDRGERKSTICKDVEYFKRKEPYKKYESDKEKRFRNDRDKKDTFLKLSSNQINRSSTGTTSQFLKSGNLSKNLFLKPNANSDSADYSSIDLHSVGSSNWRKNISTLNNPNKQETVADFHAISNSGCSKIGLSTVGSSNWRKNEISSDREETTTNIFLTPSNDVEISSLDKPMESEILSKTQLNELGAKLLRAELIGNEKLAKQLQASLDSARKMSEINTALNDKKVVGNQERETVILTHTTKTGMVMPFVAQQYNEHRKIKNTTHNEEGKILQYFADDDKYSLAEMVKREKMATAEDQNAMFARLAGRSIEKTDDDYTVDDVFINRAIKKESATKMDAKDRLSAIMNSKKTAAVLAKCQYCLESKHMSKHLIISLGKSAYLCLPASQSLTEGHCLIVPVQHEMAATMLDEDVWCEMQYIRKSLVKMFQAKNKDVIFLEICVSFKKSYHMFIEAIPLDKELGSMAPIYFKKAILDCDSVWAHNKKVIDLSGKNVRKSVPKGLPYFAVDFGVEGGFAHVIEEEHLFPHYFGREIIGGMLDLEPRRWRKPFQENFEDQRKKVLEFTEWYKNYDFTIQ